MSEEVLNNLFELRNLEGDIARKYTLYRKIEKYITDLQQENKQLKGILQEIYERAINTNITSLDFRDYILETLGDKKNE